LASHFEVYTRLFPQVVITKLKLTKDRKNIIARKGRDADKVIIRLVTTPFPHGFTACDTVCLSLFTTQ
jgi:hypothetical protein